MGCQMKDSLVSVISCFYNRSEYVCRSVESLLRQTYKNIEILLVDDGSTDDTLDQLSSYKDSRIKLISHRNKGFVRALKDAISISHGNFIAIHGSGDISLPQRIEKQIYMLMDNPNIGVVGCYRQDFSIARNLWDIQKPSVAEDQLSQLLLHNPFSHGEVMFRRSCYEQVGGYREFFEFAQDRDLWLRLAPITRFAVVPEILYRREPIEGSVTKTPCKARKQTYLSEFSIFCALTRKLKSFDPLDRYGSKAFIDFQSSISAKHKISTRLRGLVYRYAADGQFSAAKEFMKEVTDLKPSFFNVVVFRIITFAENNLTLRKLIKVLLRLRFIFKARVEKNIKNAFKKG